MLERRFLQFSAIAFSTCFITMEEAENAKKFKQAINRSCGEIGGVIWQPVSDHQLSSFLMGAYENFRSENGKTMLGTLTIGKQPDSDVVVYVMNENVQVCSKLKRNAYTKIYRASIMIMCSFTNTINKKT